MGFNSAFEGLKFELEVNCQTIDGMKSKIQKKSKMLFDKLNQYVEQESEKLVHNVVRLRWDTETDISQ